MRNIRPAELPLYRLYLLRVAFAVVGFGQGSRTWSGMFHHSTPWTMWHGVSARYSARSPYSACGIRYPVKMLPLMIFEFAWKLIWVLAAWLPLYLAHRVDADTSDVFLSIALGVVIVPLFLPWGYIWRTYVTVPGDRWR